MRLKTLIVAAAAAATALVVTAVAILSQTDFNAYRGLIADEVRAATGRELTINGELHLALSLVPAVAVEDVALANAAWGSRPDMVRIQRLEAEIAILPVLLGEIRVRRIRLVAPDILLETDPQGRGNWLMGMAAAPAPAAPPPSSPPPAKATPGGPMILPTIDAVEIRGARVRYRDGRSGISRDLALDTATLAAGHADSPLKVALAGQLDQVALAVKGTLGSMALLQRPGTPYPVNLELQAGAATARIDGVVREPLLGKGFALAVAAEGPEIADLGTLAGLPVPALGPFKLALTASDAGGGLALTGVKGEVGRAALVRATIEGKVEDALALRGVALALALRCDRLEALGAALGTALPLAGPLDLAAKVTSGEGKRLVITDLKLTQALIDLAGEVAVTPGPPRARVSLRLASTKVDLTALATAGEGSGKPSLAGGASSPPPKPARDGRVFPNDPLPLALLGLIDAEIAYQAERVEAGGTSLAKLDLEATVANGELKVSRLQVGLADGTASATLDVAAQSRTVSGRIEAKGVELGRLLKETGSSDLLSGGRTDLSADLKGRGASLREIMAGLDGSVVVATGSGRIANRYLNLASGDLLRAIQPLVGGGDSTALVCAVSRYDIRDGIATARVALLETDKVTIATAGTVSLKTEALDLMASPKPKDAALLSLAVPVQIRGTLARPTVEPEYGAAAAKAAGAVLGTVLLGPVGVVAPLISGGEGKGDACAVARAKAGLAAAGPAGAAGTPPAKAAPPAKPAAPAKGGGIGGAFDDLERGVKGLIGR